MPSIHCVPKDYLLLLMLINYEEYEPLSNEGAKG